ncbi:MAG: hypothetical protein R2716_02070 [Microthrixaceae bacterium]
MPRADVVLGAFALVILAEIVIRAGLGRKQEGVAASCDLAVGDCGREESFERCVAEPVLGHLGPVLALEFPGEGAEPDRTIELPPPSGQMSGGLVALLCTPSVPGRAGALDTRRAGDSGFVEAIQLVAEILRDVIEGRQQVCHPPTQDRHERGQLAVLLVGVLVGQLPPSVL